MNKRQAESLRTASELASLILSVSPELRASLLESAVSFLPDETMEQSFQVGPLRAAFAGYWETRFQEPVPIKRLRQVLDPPVPIGTVLGFAKFGFISDRTDVQSAVSELAENLKRRVDELSADAQRSLFDAVTPGRSDCCKNSEVGRVVESLDELLSSGQKFPTVYADPPWPYENRASRAAAENHYPSMSLDAILAEPVNRLAEKNAHLHLWTTNAFLREAIDVIAAWGFTFKSCLVWVKSDLGMGNYWRVSHEFLLLGVRGKLTFRDRTISSWIQAPRTVHSRKPSVVRTLVERVSPGPYLELYGREELPNSAWTVYGNRVEPRLF